MSAYDIDSVELSELYAYDGESLTEAYDVTGENVFSSDDPPILPEYAISNVVSYFREDTLSVASEVNALSNEWQSFIFMTDIHSGANQYNSQAIVMYLLSNTKAKQAFFAGDYCASYWNASQYDLYFSTFVESGFASVIYATIGNHEMFTNADISVIYDSFLESKSYLHGTAERYYFYFDVPSKKTRFLFINTADTSQNKVTAEQQSWITDCVTLPSSSWNLVVVGHHDIDVNNITTGWVSNNGAIVTSILSNCNGHVVGYFCGHEHIDQLRLVNNRFFQLISLCDRFENDNYFNVENYPTRVQGTVSEQVVTVVSFNTKTGDVVTRRIGAGDEYAWNFKTLQTA